MTKRKRELFSASLSSFALSIAHCNTPGSHCSYLKHSVTFQERNHRKLLAVCSASIVSDVCKQLGTGRSGCRPTSRHLQASSCRRASQGRKQEVSGAWIRKFWSIRRGDLRLPEYGRYRCIVNCRQSISVTRTAIPVSLLHTTLMQFSVFQQTSSSRSHGYASADYKRYAIHCAASIARLRKNLKLQQRSGSGKKSLYERKETKDVKSLDSRCAWTEGRHKTFGLTIYCKQAPLSHIG